MLAHLKMKLTIADETQDFVQPLPNLRKPSNGDSNQNLYYIMLLMAIWPYMTKTANFWSWALKVGKQAIPGKVIQNACQLFQLRDSITLRKK